MLTTTMVIMKTTSRMNMTTILMLVTMMRIVLATTRRIGLATMSVSTTMRIVLAMKVAETRRRIDIASDNIGGVNGDGSDSASDYKEDQANSESRVDNNENRSDEDSHGYSEKN